MTKLPTILATMLLIDSLLCERSSVGNTVGYIRRNPGSEYLGKFYILESLPWLGGIGISCCTANDDVSVICEGGTSAFKQELTFHQ